MAATARPPLRGLEWAGWLAVVAVVGGVLLAWLRVVSGFVGFRLFLAGGLVALLVGLVALVGRIRGRRLGAGPGLALVVGLVLVLLAARSRGAPMINDFTTDLADPPAFRHAATLPANAGRDLGYPAWFAAEQRGCCPDLGPIAVARPVPETVALVQATAGAMPRWQVTLTDPAAGVVEAVVTSALFGFQDDVVIRVRPDGAASRVDVRSKSRDGRGDMGVNAARIRAFAAALRARSS